MSFTTTDLTQSDDRHLLHQFVATKSPQAFEELVRRNTSMVYSAARRQLADPHLAEDVTQAVFLLLAQKAGSINGSLPGWLLAVTYNACRNARRIASRRAYHETQAAAMKQHESQPDPEITWNDYAPMIDAAMSRLGRHDRDAIALRYFREFSLKDVGASLGISEEAARKRVDRAVAKLRTLLSSQSAVPALAVFASQLASKATLQTPAHLVQSILVSLTASAQGTLAGVIATKTSHAIAWAKIKIAAAIILAVGAAGVSAGTVIKFARTAQAPIAVTPSPPPSPVSSVSAPPPAIPEVSVPGTIQLARWEVFVNDRTAQQLRQILQPVQTQSAFYSAFRGNGADIRKLIAGAVQNGGLQQASNDLKISLDHSQLGNIPEGELAFNDFILSLGMNAGPAVFSFNCYSQPINDNSLLQDHFLVQGPSRVHADINDPNLNIQFNSQEGSYIRTLRTTPAKVAMEFQGDLNTGDAMLMIARYVSETGKSFNNVVVWETFHAIRDQKSTIASETSSQWWCVNGPEKLRRWGDASRLWATQADPHAQTAPPFAIERKLSDGKSIWLTMLARPSLWPGCWWNAGGRPVNWMGGIQFNGDPPGGLWFAFELHGDKNEWPLQRAPGAAGLPHYSFDYNVQSIHQEGDQTTALKVGAPVGTWQEIARLKPGAKSTLDGVTFQVLCPSPKLSWLSVEFSRHGILHDQYEIVAVDRTGKEYFDPRLATNPDWAKFINVDAPEDAEDQFNFNSLKPGDLADFKLIRRQRQFVTFDGFPTQPALAPREDVTTADADAAESARDQRAAQAQLSDLQSKRKFWEAIKPDPKTPDGFMRLLLCDALAGNASDIRSRIVTTDPQISKLIDDAIPLFILNQSIRNQAIHLYGIQFVDSQMTTEPLLVDLEAGLMDGSWNPTPDGDGYEMPLHDQYVLRKQPSGELCMDLGVLPRDEKDDLLGFETAIAPQIAKGQRLVQLLTARKPPTLAEFRAALQK